jgi:hypothetical protein
LTATASPPPDADGGTHQRRRGWARAGLWLAGGLMLVAFSWLPLSYYRMVGWAWILLWQLGGVALLVGTLAAATVESGLLCPRLRAGWSGDGHGSHPRPVGPGVAFSPVALWNVSLAVTYGACCTSTATGSMGH